MRPGFSDLTCGRIRKSPQLADRGWKRRFEAQIPLPRGRSLVTLEDAGKYITKLPKAEHEAAEWQSAMEALILVATSGGADDVCAHRHHASVEPRQVRSGTDAAPEARQAYRVIR
jgi:hypothetical protein